MLCYFVSALAIAAIFIVTKKPWLAFATWTCTNGFWMSRTASQGDYDQAIMFTAFVIASAIQFWRTYE